MTFQKVRIEEALEIHNSTAKEKLSKIGLSKLIKSKVNTATVQNYIQRAITGEKEMPLHILIQISLILGVTIDYLLGFSQSHKGAGKRATSIFEMASKMKLESAQLVKDLDNEK